MTYNYSIFWFLTEGKEKTIPSSKIQVSKDPLQRRYPTWCDAARFDMVRCN